MTQAKLSSKFLETASVHIFDLGPLSSPSLYTSMGQLHIHTFASPITTPLSRWYHTAARGPDCREPARLSSKSVRCESGNIFKTHQRETKQHAGNRPKSARHCSNICQHFPTFCIFFDIFNFSHFHMKKWTPWVRYSVWT